jgi:hypothetical protein
MTNKKIKEPSFQFYPQDFLTGCAGLTLTERGQYITLLCLQHQTGHLTEKIIKLNIGKWSPELKLKFVKDNEGLYYNERLESEIHKREEHRKHQAENSSKTNPELLPTVLPKQLQDDPKYDPKMGPLEDENNIIEYKEVISKYRRIIPPSIKLVRLYCLIRKNGIDANYFVEYYTARGWVYGKQKTAIVDWQAVVRTWEQHNKQNEPGRVNLTDFNNERKYRTT